ncbi:uncharacterized protein MELLADRAFT_64015 [Melampsora larici-populina 98AG31]|uniref:Uncharacterized protein n=1 Tax=Melampsora larici-populina (strain 98AG31 / pathotype 3-4-7) TaxID=747676 RepID=F4RPV6_MELLP|nr:uncharacterized protein MELLADRAFT_64015 [Melampsora larici-populina 98AG31]EGG05672.1 hypothetical protein MELLADRAFT_64015 [Melampsora larici-populina 98AG31]
MSKLSSVKRSITSLLFWGRGLHQSKSKALPFLSTLPTSFRVSSGHCTHVVLFRITSQCATNSGHYFRTFKLNQLNHEIALINAGHPYPIPFDRSAHGPPVNLQGGLVVPRQSKRQAAANAKMADKRGPPAIDCARAAHGPTATKHKKWGHTGCTLHYCKSCCHAYGTGDCYVHRVKDLTGKHPVKVTALAHPLHQSPPPPHKRTTPPAEIPTAKRPRTIPQCAQSIHRAGRIVPEDAEASMVIERARQAQMQVHKKVSASLTEDGQVVSLHLVTKNQQLNPIISHSFKTWPMAALDDCPSLLRQAKDAAGATWEDRLLIWDEAIRNWNLVICVPSQHSALTAELQDALERFALGKPMVPTPPKALEHTSTPILKGAVVKQETPTLKANPSLSLYGSSSDPICFLEDSESEGDSDKSQDKNSTPPSSSLANVPSTLLSHLGQEEEEVSIFKIQTQCNLRRAHVPHVQLPQAESKPSIPELATPPAALPPLQPPQLAPALPTPALASVLREWPGEDLRVSALYEWYASSPGRGSRVPKWKQQFGSTYNYEKSTVYRYWGFVDLVGENRFKQWLEAWGEEGEINWHNVAIPRARDHFRAEWDIITGLKR